MEGGAIAPDSWGPGKGLTPAADFVVSRAKDGTVLSRYKDLTWDLSPYQVRGRTLRLHFCLLGESGAPERAESLLDEMHFLMFVLIWIRPSAPLTTSSLNGYLVAIRRLGAFAGRKSCRIRDVLNSEIRLAEFAHNEVSGAVLVQVRALLKLLFKLGSDEIGFPVLGTISKSILDAKISKYNAKIRQFPPIPTRIYSSIITCLSFELKAWETVEKRYLALLAECLNDPLLGKNKTHQVTLGTKRGISRTPGEYEPDFKTMLSRYELTDYFEKADLAPSVHGLALGLSSVMNVAKLSIITFTGMRNAEARDLPYKCLEEEIAAGGVVHRLICGRTTKLQKVRTRWVTSEEGHRAVRIIQRIATVIYQYLGENPSKSKEADDTYPLFVSTSYLRLTGKITKSSINVFQALSNSFFSEKYDVLRARIQPLIEEGDLKELEHIDPHRAWRSEDEFQLGKQWRLTEHQFRRSLALYAQRSGLVSLPSLRRQLQHITEEMSRYYARGSLFAKNFIGEDKEHFGWEWQEAVPVSSGLAFIRDVLFANEPTFGGYVKWIEHRLNGPEGNILLDRDVTMRRFLNGEIEYRETPVGGCTRVGPCKVVGIRFLDVDCLGGCPTLVGRLSKLEQAIKGQTVLVNRLMPGSTYWLTEKADLDVLIETRERVLRTRGRA